MHKVSLYLLIVLTTNPTSVFCEGRKRIQPDRACKLRNKVLATEETQQTEATQLYETSVSATRKYLKKYNLSKKSYPKMLKLTGQLLKASNLSQNNLHEVMGYIVASESLDWFRQQKTPINPFKLRPETAKLLDSICLHICDNTPAESVEETFRNTIKLENIRQLIFIIETNSIAMRNLHEYWSKCLDMMTQLHALEIINIEFRSNKTYSQQDPSPIIDYLSRLPNLNGLELSGIKNLGCYYMNFIDALTKLTNIKILGFNCSNWDRDMHKSLLNSLRNLPKLDKLEIQCAPSNKIKELVTELPEIKTLCIGQCYCHSSPCSLRAHLNNHGFFLLPSRISPLDNFLYVWQKFTTDKRTIN